MRESFHHHLDGLRLDVVRLAAMVTDSIPRGTDVLLFGDLGEAQAIIDHDDDLDRLALEIEDRCFHLMATQQPMASDLRALITALRLVSELERSGDLVVNVVKGAWRIHLLTIDPRTRGMVAELSAEARKLVETAIDAYVDGDDVSAAALDVLDDRVDDLHRELIGHLLEACRAGVLDVQAAVQLALIGRYYERIADHAVNIGERVRYMVTGWTPGQDRVPDRTPQA